MNIRFILCAAVALLFPVQLLLATPKLVVLVVVDQMRADYFDRFDHDFSHGLKTLRYKSIFYSNAFYEHIPTETAPGHATLITGEPPRAHGIIGNDWFDRELARTVLSIEDSKVGKSPHLLMSPAVPDRFKEKYPNSKVISIAMKDRSAILIGGHKADIAIWFDKKKKEFVTSDYYQAENRHWLYDVAEKVRNPIRWRLTPLGVETFLTTPATDQSLYALVEPILKRLKETPSPNFLCISFSGTDYVGHRYGPDSSEIKLQLLSLDKIIGKLIGQIDRMTEHDFVLALTADHGVSPLASPKSQFQKVRESTLRKNFEKIAQTLYPSGELWITSFQFPNVYLNPKLVQQAGVEARENLRKRFREIANVAEVYDVNNLTDDEWTPVYRRSIYPGRSGDFLVRMKPGTIIGHQFQGTTHGSPYENDSHVPLLIYRPGLKGETVTEKVSVERLAPSLEYLLDLSTVSPHAVLPGLQ